jgi:hypothetical protein
MTVEDMNRLGETEGLEAAGAPRVVAAAGLGPSRKL